MKKYFLIVISVLFFTSAISVADTSDIKDKFFSSIENFLDGNFEDTDFSIKTKEVYMHQSFSGKKTLWLSGATTDPQQP